MVLRCLRAGVLPVKADNDRLAAFYEARALLMSALDKLAVLSCGHEAQLTPDESRLIYEMVKKLGKIRHPELP
jgi:hypothetical protein